MPSKSRGHVQGQVVSHRHQDVKENRDGIPPSILEILPRPKPSSQHLANQMTQMSIKDKKDKMIFYTFDQMNLNPDLLKGIQAMGYETPAVIQQRAIMPGIRGRDLIMQVAQSGMGKTTGMLFVVLQKIDLTLKKPQALIVVPTRELALQIEAFIRTLGQYMPVKYMACVGGRRTRNEKQNIGTSQIIFGPLDRIANHLDPPIGPDDTRLPPRFDGLSLKMFVLDGAEKMFTEYSFRVDLQRVFAKVSGDAKIILVSSTMPPLVKKNAGMVCRNPARFLIDNSEMTLKGIRQFYVKFGPTDIDTDDAKVDTLAEILPLLYKNWTFIFCNSRQRVEDLCEKLSSRGLAVVSLLGLKTAKEREKILQDFKKGRIHALISTDLHGRGSDIQPLSVVINYDLPEKNQWSQYIHRVGRERVGRYSRGVAITFVIEKEMIQLKMTEYNYKSEIKELPYDLDLILT